MLLVDETKVRDVISNPVPEVFISYQTMNIVLPTFGPVLSSEDFVENSYW